MGLWEDVAKMKQERDEGKINKVISGRPPMPVPLTMNEQYVMVWDSCGPWGYSIPWGKWKADGLLPMCKASSTPGGKFVWLVHKGSATFSPDLDKPGTFPGSVDMKECGRVPIVYLENYMGRPGVNDAVDWVALRDKIIQVAREHEIVQERQKEVKKHPAEEMQGVMSRLDRDVLNTLIRQATESHLGIWGSLVGHTPNSVGCKAMESILEYIFNMESKLMKAGIMSDPYAEDVEDEVDGEEEEELEECPSCGEEGCEGECEDEEDEEEDDLDDFDDDDEYEEDDLDDDDDDDLDEDDDEEE